MVKHDAPQIKSVNISKEGRFWSLKVDGKLLAIILYKRGAEAAQEMLQRLAGLPVTVIADDDGEPKAAKPPTLPKKKEPTKTKPAAPPKAKPPAKKTDDEPAKLEAIAAPLNP